MKVIHCADIHLDSKMEANLTKEQAKQRKDELLLTFCAMVEYGAAQDVRVIIVAGDLFDTKHVTAKTRKIVLDAVNAHPEIDFLYLRGNHDEEEGFWGEEETFPPNLKRFGNDWTAYEYGNVNISGVELCKENNLRIYNTLYLNQNQVNIVVLHGQESNYHGKEQSEIINLRELSNKNIDYLALGHLHSYKLQKLDKRGVYCYAGCLEGRGFDECGEKGFVLLEVSEEGVLPHFMPFAKRTLYEVPIDLTGLVSSYEIENAISTSLLEIPKESLVKIILEGSVEVETMKDVDYLTKKFAEDYFFLKIYDRTRLELHIEDYQHDISLKGEFIRMVLAERIPEEKKNRIILNGIKALSGEELI